MTISKRNKVRDLSWAATQSACCHDTSTSHALDRRSTQPLPLVLRAMAPQRLVHILETIKPYYSVEKWEEDRRNQEGVLKWMAKVHYRPSKDGLEAFRDRELPKLEVEMDGPDHQEESTAPPSLGVSEEGLKAEGSTNTARGAPKHSGSLKKIDSARGGAKVEEGAHMPSLRKALTAPTLPRSSSMPLSSSRQDTRRSSGGALAGGDTARKGNSRAGNLHRIKEAQQAAGTSGAASSGSGDMQQVRDRRGHSRMHTQQKLDDTLIGGRHSIACSYTLARIGLVVMWVWVCRWRRCSRRWTRPRRRRPSWARHGACGGGRAADTHWGRQTTRR